jgi:hypothetical protein
LRRGVTKPSMLHIDCPAVELGLAIKEARPEASHSKEKRVSDSSVV